MTVNSHNWERIILGSKKTTQDFLDNILENTVESIIVTDLEGKIVFFNKGSEQIFRYTVGEILGMHVRTLGARKPDVLEKIRRGEIFRGQLSLARKTGDRFNAFIVCLPLFDENDKPMAMVGTARDLTEEEESARAERMIARLKEFNENIIASLNEGIQIVNHNGEITFTNRRFEEMSGYNRDEILGRPCESFIAREAHEKFLREIRASDENKKVFETTLATRDGRRIAVLVSTSSLWEAGKYRGTINAFTDMTEINILKEELFQSEKMTLLGKLAGEIAHEINNPLGGLIIATQMLIDDVQTRGRINRRNLLAELKGIENDATRCKRFIGKVLNFAKKIPDEKAMVNLHSLIDDSLLLVQRQARLENITIRKVYSPADLYTVGNSNNLQQVIINIVNNAREAILPSRGEITVKTSAKADDRKRWASIEIDDTGRGIPKDLIERIFDSFFTTKPKGTGLGLSVSKRIIEEHGGKLTAKNIPGGASFTVSLPYSVE